MEFRSPDEQDHDLCQRKGYFEISSDLLRGRPALFKRIVGDGVVVQVDYNHMMDISTYYIFHPQFRKIDEGEVVPKYKVEVTRPDAAASYDDFEVTYVEDIT